MTTSPSRRERSFALGAKEKTTGRCDSLCYRRSRSSSKPWGAPFPIRRGQDTRSSSPNSGSLAGRVGGARTIRFRWHEVQWTHQTLGPDATLAAGCSKVSGESQRGHSTAAPGVSTASRMRATSALENGALVRCRHSFTGSPTRCQPKAQARPHQRVQQLAKGLLVRLQELVRRFEGAEPHTSTLRRTVRGRHQEGNEVCYWSNSENPMTVRDLRRALWGRLLERNADPVMRDANLTVRCGQCGGRLEMRTENMTGRAVEECQRCGTSRLVPRFLPEEEEKERPIG